MGLSSQQLVLARLLTDAALRARFQEDPQTVGREWNLTPDDVTCLSALRIPDLERSARSLTAKRWNEIEKLLPLSMRAAAQHQVPLQQWFQRFARSYVPQGAKRHAQDAQAFAAWTAEQHGEMRNSSGDASVPWLPDLLRYEATWLAANLDTRPRFLCLGRFRTPVHRLARALAQNASEARIKKAPARPTLTAWFRLSPSGKVRHLVLSLQGRQEEKIWNQSNRNVQL